MSLNPLDINHPAPSLIIRLISGEPREGCERSIKGIAPHLCELIALKHPGLPNAYL